MPQPLIIVEEINLPLTAAQLFDRLATDRLSFFLDSGMDPNRLGRYSFMGSEPFLVLRSRGRNISLEWPDYNEQIEGNPFDILQGLMRKFRLPRGEHPIPFTGGAVGYFAYDLGRHLERLPSWATDDLAIPEMYLGFYDGVIGVDHLTGKVWLAAAGVSPSTPHGDAELARRRIAELAAKLRYSPPHVPAPGTVGTIARDFTPKQYRRSVSKVKEYIAAGDIFQANLTQRFSVPIGGDPYALYRVLREVNPAPFASYLNFGEVVVASASPERFIQVVDKRVETRPIKGTRPRGATPAEDAALRAELWESAKDRAELTMIIDLERNDLGRVCLPGTVRVPELYCLEEYPTVFHLVSTVVGQLPPDRDVIDLLKASFPGGSITGAPKIRAMEIIEELEPVRRSIYTGSIGYLDFNGDADLNIVIRTFVIKEGTAYFQVGGGIVADSDPEMEYQETLHKARGLLRALDRLQSMAEAGK